MASPSAGISSTFAVTGAEAKMEEHPRQHRVGERRRNGRHPAAERFPQAGKHDQHAAVTMKAPTAVEKATWDPPVVAKRSRRRPVMQC